MSLDQSEAARQFDLLLEIDRVLRASCYSAMRNVCYGISNGRLILEGTVPSYFMKQLAQTLVATIVDEHSIDNQIVVERESSHAPRRLHELAAMAGSVA
jgi:hypothetical protein